MSDLRKLVGAQIRVLRKRKGLSQLELAAKAGLQDTYVGGVERGTRNISLETLEKIVGALEVEPAEVFHFGNIDVETELHEKKQVLDVHRSFLMNRSLEEVKMVQRVVKDMFSTIDSEKQK
ncbi:helix-turn-helix domain-containing protein [uncultured Brevibacillus sp.]|uniref:helix-turn-helix domain-containing protein n=1 Tax=uncultured Brevibacillus sp. TaxID=169970 RepID=UPI0025918345|nr:helix-turn-helix transcriptional regulator [uncultured Brevibacillus sp.]